MGFPLCCAILIGADLLLLALVAPWRYGQYGLLGVWSAVLALAICLFGGLAAMAGAYYLRGPYAMGSLAIGLVFRAALPLGAAIVLGRADTPLAEAAIDNNILIFYLCTLVVEVSLLGPLMKSIPPADVAPASDSSSSAPAQRSAQQGEVP